MYRILLILQLHWCSCCILGVVPDVRGEESPDKKPQKLADDSRSRAEGITVSVTIGKHTTEAMLHPSALMKYTGVIGGIEMATLWMWQIEGRPVALAKVEAWRGKGGPKWLYCFASTSTELVEGQWPAGHHFRAKKPGIEWIALEGPIPQETAAGRRRQMKDLFRRFSAVCDGNHLRPLATPLHEYSSPKQGVLQGTLCGLTTNGTNPAVIIALEAVRPVRGKNDPQSWRYGVIGMASNSISVKLDKEEVFTRPGAWPPGDRDTWTFFREGQSKK